MELEHATRYAVETTKLFLMQFLKDNYPHFFKNAIVEFRPATLKDYYVPPAIADKCIVVTKMAFDEIGCKRFNCFPMTENLEPCSDNPRWIPIGSHYHLACQSSCSEQNDTVETLWKDGKCLLLNPLKKMLAINPEQLFEKTSRGHLHNGLDVKEGQLQLNPRYCDVYGLNFQDGECIQTFGQKVGEFFIGRSLYRSAVVKNLPPLIQNPPRDLPEYLNYKKPVRRHITEIAKDIAIEFGKDALVDITSTVLQDVFKKKVPKFLSKITVNDIGAKVAMKAMIKKSMILGTTKILIALGNVINVATALYDVFSIVADVLDTIDPFDFNKVLDRSTLNELNKTLDYQYFRELGRNPELTIEDVWNRDILDIEDQSDIYEYMSERVKEYLDALVPVRKTIQLTKIEPKISKDYSQWKHAIVTFMLLCVMMVFIKYIHIWSTLLFFVLIYFKPM